MQLHMAAGDRASAMQTFAQLKDRLSEMLGVDPSPETLELHRRMLF
jgi:DNA-binding SARP family transcriptional activator